MYRKILNYKKYSFQKKIWIIIQYMYLRMAAHKGFIKRYKNNDQNGYIKIDHLLNKNRREYINYWRDFRRKAETKTLEMCYNLSGKFDLEIIPEEIFAADIEPSLNQRSEIMFLCNKSYYNKWFTENLFPRDYLHKIDGVLMNTKFKRISLEEIPSILSSKNFPVVIKPNIDTYGGKDVFFPKNISEVIKIVEGLENFVIQEKIFQNSYFNDIYDESLNTIRVCVYRSVANDSLNVLNCSLRIGKDGSLDNETAGGIVCNIDSKGYMNSFAVDKYGVKYKTHPNTGFIFGGQIPFYDALLSKSRFVCQQVPYARLISLDVCLTEDNEWKIIEINLQGQTIRFAQYAGKPFFGEFTDEVKEYCKINHWTLNR